MLLIFVVTPGNSTRSHIYDIDLKLHINVYSTHTHMYKYIQKNIYNKPKRYKAKNLRIEWISNTLTFMISFTFLLSESFCSNLIFINKDVS